MGSILIILSYGLVHYGTIKSITEVLNFKSKQSMYSMKETPRLWQYIVIVW